MSIFEVAVIGSGPGGNCGIRAANRAGKKTIWIEEGSLGQDTEPFSQPELLHKYRSGGQTLIFSRPLVPIAQPLAVGGGLAINAGLYQLPEREVYNSWSLSSQQGWEWEKIVEEDAAIRSWFNPKEPREKDPITSMMRLAASELAWVYKVIPTMDISDRKHFDQTNRLELYSQGGSFLPATKVHSLEFEKGVWKINCLQNGKKISFYSMKIFLAAGAVQTPALLMRSGLIPRFLTEMKYHPVVKVVAEFENDLGLERTSLSSLQIKQFSPRVSIGASVTSRGLLWTEVLKSGISRIDVLSKYRRQALFYCSTSSSPKTFSYLPPLGTQPLQFSLSSQCTHDLDDGVENLVRFCFAMKAKKIYLAGQEFESFASYSRQRDRLHHSMSAIHLFSLLSLGKRKGGLIGSDGQLIGAKNVYVLDASILPGSPGVNPQALTMVLANMIARRALGHADNARSRCP